MNLTAEHLLKRYGDFSLDLPAFEIASGETVGLVGNNGAGKTTFLRLILDLIEADEGHVLLDEQDVSQIEEWKSAVGSYLDESFLIDFLTADEYLAFVGDTYGLTAAERNEALAPYRAFYTDEPLGETTKYLRDLSQGNRKKAGLLAALFVQPRLLILDEPFTHLDPRSQIQLKETLRRLRDEQGTTMLISSHDLGHVTEVCERIAILEAGRIARDEPTTEATLDDLQNYFADTLRPREVAAHS